MIMTYTAVSRLLPAANVGGAMGVLATCGALGIAVGSPLGGFLTERFSWQWVFFINVPVGLLAILFASWAIPGGGGAEKRSGRMDCLGALLSILGVVSFILAMELMTLFASAGAWNTKRTIWDSGLSAGRGGRDILRRSTACLPSTSALGASAGASCSPSRWTANRIACVTCS